MLQRGHIDHGGAAFRAGRGQVFCRVVPGCVGSLLGPLLDHFRIANQFRVLSVVGPESLLLSEFD